ncbi:hypothetical protein [Bacteroides acidifaciens]|uniref:hypothetical protein n=1 Tax=Bacteroides acidifaciens TaxID=85831 RepID=UPI00259B1992|nr:hypothetical protein [Bacteroides acidifaciens]
MLGFELKVVEAHGRGRRRKAQRHLTLLTDAVISHRKTSILTAANNSQENPSMTYKSVVYTQIQ